MKVIAGGAGKTGGSLEDAPPAAPGAGAPVGSPMTTPQPNEGMQQAAAIDVSMALDLLERSLPPFGSDSKEGKALFSALDSLSKVFGDRREKAKTLVPAELMQLMSSLPQAGGATPEMKALMGGGAPGGAAPPPMGQ